MVSLTPSVVAVASSPSAISSPPSPVKASAPRSGSCSAAAMPAGRAKPMVARPFEISRSPGRSACQKVVQGNICAPASTETRGSRPAARHAAWAISTTAWGESPWLPPGALARQRQPGRSRCAAIARASRRCGPRLRQRRQRRGQRPVQRRRRRPVVQRPRRGAEVDHRGGEAPGLRDELHRVGPGQQDQVGLGQDRRLGLAAGEDAAEQRMRHPAARPWPCR